MSFSRYPVVDEWFNKLWHIQTMEYCYAVKTNALLIEATTWINLHTFWLSEKKIITKGYISMIVFIYFSWNDTIIEIENGLILARGESGVKKRLLWLLKYNMRNSDGDANFLFLTTPKPIPGEWHYDTAARYYHWWKVVKVHLGSLCIISYNCMWICNYIKTVSLIKK